MSDKEFNYYISGETGKWEVVIGLEVHAQVSSNHPLQLNLDQSQIHR